jgi:hypothetical protein
MSVPEKRVSVAVSMLSKTTGSVTYVQFLGTPEYDRVVGVDSIAYTLVTKKCDPANWKKVLMRVHGDELFPVQDARVQYVIRVRSSEVTKFFSKSGRIKQRPRIAETHMPEIKDPQLVDMGINYAVGQNSDHSLDFYARYADLRDFLIMAFRPMPLNGAVDGAAEDDACSVALRTVGARHVLNSAWSDLFAPMVERARLAIHIKGDKVIKTAPLAEIANISNESTRRRMTNMLKRCPLKFDPDTSSLEVWLRKVTAYIFGGNATFALNGTPMSSLVTDPLRTLALTADMSGPYARTYGHNWCDALNAAARGFIQTGTGDFGLADGRSCVFAAPRGEHAPPEYAVNPRTPESMSYHKEGETTCWRHPMLFDTAAVDVSTDARDVHTLRGGAGLPRRPVKAAAMANCEWLLLRSPKDIADLHRLDVSMKESANAQGFKTRMRILNGYNADCQSLRISTIQGTSIGANESFSGMLDGGNSQESYTHAMFLDVRNGEYVGLPIAAAMIMSRACANKPKALLDAAYVRADSASFGEADARAAALLAAFFKRVGVMVPFVRDDDSSEQAVKQREHNTRVVRMVGDAVDDLRHKLTRDDDDDEPDTAADGGVIGWEGVARVAKRQRRV